MNRSDSFSVMQYSSLVSRSSKLRNSQKHSWRFVQVQWATVLIDSSTTLKPSQPTSSRTTSFTASSGGFSPTTANSGSGVTTNSASDAGYSNFGRSPASKGTDGADVSANTSAASTASSGYPSFGSSPLQPSPYSNSAGDSTARPIAGIRADTGTGGFSTLNSRQSQTSPFSPSSPSIPSSEGYPGTGQPQSESRPPPVSDQTHAPLSPGGTMMSEPMGRGAGADVASNDFSNFGSPGGQDNVSASAQSVPNPNVEKRSNIPPAPGNRYRQPSRDTTVAYNDPLVTMPHTTIVDSAIKSPELRFNPISTRSTRARTNRGSYIKKDFVDNDPIQRRTWSSYPDPYAQRPPMRTRNQQRRPASPHGSTKTNAESSPTSIGPIEPGGQRKITLRSPYVERVPVALAGEEGRNMLGGPLNAIVQLFQQGSDATPKQTVFVFSEDSRKCVPVHK